MQSYLIVRIKATAGESGMPIQWAEVNVKGKLQGPVHEGDWPLLKEWLGNLPPAKHKSFADNIVLLLPGTLTTNYRLTISAAQKKHAPSVVPFLLEEQLTTDIEDFHFAYQVRNDSKIDVTVAPVELLNQLIELMAENDFEPVKIIAEDQLFSHDSTENQLTLFIENNYVHVCSAKHPGATVDAEAFILILDQLISGKKAEEESQEGNADQSDQNESLITNITFYQPAHDTKGKVAIQSYLKQHYPDISVDTQTLQEEGGYFAFLANRLLQNIKKRTLINLRTGPFVCRKRVKQHQKAWKMVAIATGIWLMAEIFLSLGTSLFYHYKSRSFESESLALYKKYFPNDQSVVDVRTSLERKLRSVGKQSQPNAFFSILEKISAPEIASGKIKLQIIEYHEKNNNFTIQLAAPGYDEINNYINVLRNKKLSALMSDASNDKEKKQIIAKLKITRGV